MYLRNPFSEETREYFLWNYECFYCGKNNWNSLHHILGRISSSPLNACPIHNIGCHIGNGVLSTFKIKKQLLKKTLMYLRQNGYHLTTEDTLFMKQNSKYYE